MDFTKVYLSQGRYAILDNEDLQLISGYVWSAKRDGKNYYAVSKDKNGVTLYMHHLVIPKPEAGYETDHKNRNGLDNRKDNLQTVTKTINQLNRSPNKGTKFPQGVFKNGQGYSARCRKKDLGTFSTPELAGEAYQQYKQKLVAELIGGK